MVLVLVFVWFDVYFWLLGSFLVLEGVGFGWGWFWVFVVAALCP